MAGVLESTTRVRGVAGIAELVLAELRGTLTPLLLEGERMVRESPLETSAAPVSGAVRALRTVRSVPEPLGSTRLPRALWMAEEVVGEAERSTATLRKRASREDSVMGVRSIRPPVRSTGEKVERVELDCNSALRADAVMLRGPMVSGPRMTRRGE